MSPHPIIDIVDNGQDTYILVAADGTSAKKPLTPTTAAYLMRKCADFLAKQADETRP